MLADRIGPSYDESFAESYDDIFADEAESARVAGFLEMFFAGAKTLLELGVGTGRVAIPLARQGVGIIGVDDSEAMLGRLRKKLESETDVSVQPIVADMRDLPDGLAADGVYSVLGSLSCLPSSDDRRRAFAQARRPVKAGSGLVLEVYNPFVIRAMHGDTEKVLHTSTEYPESGGSLASEYRLDGTLWRAAHVWTADGVDRRFAEAVSLVEPQDLAAEAAPWWRPRALLRDWSGAEMDHRQEAMMILVFEADGEEGNA